MRSAATERRGAGATMIDRPTGEGGRRNTTDELRRVVTESLNVGNPANNAKALSDMADPNCEYQLDLAVDEIRPYDRNPRRANNARFDEIKASIRVSGIRNPLTVTRRPGEQHFIVESGGNTRLIAIQQLWTETNEARFQRITVLFRPWRSESHVLTAHLIENEQRAELTFWDKAAGIMALKRELEAEKGGALSLRQFEADLKQLGFPVSIRLLSHFHFAIGKLDALGDVAQRLSDMDLRVIQPRLNLIKRYAEQRLGTSESVLYEQVLIPVFHQYRDRGADSDVVDAQALCYDCEESLASFCKEPVAQIRTALDAMEQSSDAPVARTNAGAPAGVMTQSSQKGPEPITEVLPAVTGVTGGNTGERSAGPRQITIAGRRGDEDTEPRGEGGVRHAPSRSTAAETRLAEVSAQTTPLIQLKEVVTRFAQLTVVRDCLTYCAALPCGYYMEVPQSPLDLDPNKPLRHRAWWLLALLSGQMHDAIVPRMPKTSRWRCAHEGDDSDDMAMPLLIENELGGLVYFDAELANWLLDPTDEMATLFWELVLRVRELKCVMPHESPACTTRQAPETEG